MKVLIRNPAPDNQAIQHFWGDFHYGAAFSQCLKELGCKVIIQYWPNWVEAEADVLLVLRGLRKIEEIQGEFNKKFVWLISHPDDVSDEELRLFDTILSGSQKHNKELKQRGFKAHQFLQCTDDSVFYPRIKKKSDLSNAFIFVGNNRGITRPLVVRAINAQLPLKIWGTQWTDSNYEPFIVNEYFPNQHLGELYRNSYCTLNDHWDDMVSFNYVNNRVFDALACGLPLLTEFNPGIVQLNLNGYKVIYQEKSFDNALDEFIMNYDHYQEAAYNDAFLIQKDHTFKVRAQQFLSLLK